MVAPIDFTNRRVLVVEDDILIAFAIIDMLQDRGIQIIGPAATIETAIDLIDAAPNIDAAILDMNLRGRMAFAVADALLDRNVPFVFMTGYNRAAIPLRHAHVALCEKPATTSGIMAALFQ